MPTGRRSAVEHEIDPSPGLRARAPPLVGRESGEAVGAGRGDRHAGRADQLERQRMRRHAQPTVSRPAVTIVRNVARASAAPASAGRASSAAPAAPPPAAIRRPASRAISTDSTCTISGLVGGPALGREDALHRLRRRARSRPGRRPSRWETRPALPHGSVRRARTSLFMTLYSGSSSLPSPAVLPVFRHTR